MDAGPRAVAAADVAAHVENQFDQYRRSYRRSPPAGPVVVS